MLWRLSYENSELNFTHGSSHTFEPVWTAHKYDAMNLSWKMTQDAAMNTCCHIQHVDAIEDFVLDFIPWPLHNHS